MPLQWMFLSLLSGNVLMLTWLLAPRNELKFGPHRVPTLTFSGLWPYFTTY